MIRVAVGVPLGAVIWVLLVAAMTGSALDEALYTTGIVVATFGVVAIPLAAWWGFSIVRME